MSAAGFVAVAWFAVLAALTLRLGANAPLGPTGRPDPDALHVNLFLAGIPLGILATGLTAWLLMRPIMSLWRRGGLSMVSALGGLSAAMLVTFLARESGGMIALAATAVIAVVGAIAVARRALGAA